MVLTLQALDQGSQDVQSFLDEGYSGLHSLIFIVHYRLVIDSNFHLMQFCIFAPVVCLDLSSGAYTITTPFSPLEERRAKQLT